MSGGALIVVAEVQHDFSDGAQMLVSKGHRLPGCEMSRGEWKPVLWQRSCG
jgi:hypothetical protein